VVASDAPPPPPLAIDPRASPSLPVVSDPLLMGTSGRAAVRRLDAAMLATDFKFRTKAAGGLFPVLRAVQLRAGAEDARGSGAGRIEFRLASSRNNWVVVSRQSLRLAAGGSSARSQQQQQQQQHGVAALKVCSGGSALEILS
jgi:hypothetical protein